MYLGWRFTRLCVSPSPREGSLNPRKGPVCFFSCQNTPATSLLPPLITILTISGIIGLMAFTEHILCPRQHGAPNEVVLLLSLSYQGRNGGSESVTCPRPHSLGARLGLRSSPPGGSQGPFGLHPSRDIKGRHNLPFTIPGRSPSCLSASACPATCPGPSPISALAELRCQLFLEPLPECPACCEQL